MKTFLVFLALSIVFLSAFAFAADINRYAMMQKSLKTIAEECACGASMMIASDSLSYGYLEIDRNAARERAVYLCGELSASVPILRKGKVTLSDIYVAEDHVDVELTYVQETDMFRMPFLEKYSFSREAEYKWE